MSPVSVAPSYDYRREETADEIIYTATAARLPVLITLVIVGLLGLILGVYIAYKANNLWMVIVGFAIVYPIVHFFDSKKKEYTVRILKNGGHLIINGQQYDRDHIKEINHFSSGGDSEPRSFITMLYGVKKIYLFRDLYDGTGTALYSAFSADLGIK